MIRKVLILAVFGCFINCNLSYCQTGGTDAESVTDEVVAAAIVAAAGSQEPQEAQQQAKKQVVEGFLLQEEHLNSKYPEVANRKQVVEGFQLQEEHLNQNLEKVQQLRAHLLLQQLLQQLGQHQQSLGNTLKVMETLENQILDETLSSRQKVLEAADKFATSLKEHMAEIEKRIQSEEVGDRRARAAREHQRLSSAKALESEAHDALAKSQAEQAKLKAEMARLDAQRAQAAASAEAFKSKMAREYEIRLQAQLAKQAQDSARAAASADANPKVSSSEESPQSAKWAEVDARLERIEKFLEKLAAEKEKQE